MRGPSKQIHDSRVRISESEKLYTNLLMCANISMQTTSESQSLIPLKIFTDYIADYITVIFKHDIFIQLSTLAIKLKRKLYIRMIHLNI